MIHYAGVTAYNEVQSDTPVAVDNGGSGGTGLTTFLERRVVVAVREVTRRDLHEGGPASREGTDRGGPRTAPPPGRRPSDRLPAGGGDPPSHQHIFGERSVLPSQAAPGTCAVLPGERTLPFGMPSGSPLVRAPSPPSPPPAGPGMRLGRAQLPAAARSPGAPRSLRSPTMEINECLFRAARPSSEPCPVISGERGREERLSAGSALHVPASGGAARQVPERGQRGLGWLAGPRGQPYPGARG